MSGLLVPNYPQLASKTCCTTECDCSTAVDFGDIFSGDKLFKLEKEDNICDAYDKINKNFKMLANAYELLAKAVEYRFTVSFGDTVPISYQGPFFFLIDDNNKLYVWNEPTAKYIPAYGKNSMDSATEDFGESHVANNYIPDLEHIRNICDGIEISTFTKRQGEMEINFVAATPTCNVGLFIYDKSDDKLKIWSPTDSEYVSAYGCNSINKMNEVEPTTEGKVNYPVVV